MLLLSLLCLVPATDLVLQDGDRVVMVGGALIEREQLNGYVELMLHALFPDKKFTVRNLGWSGDTVWGEARAGFGPPAEGYKKLVEQVKAEKPTVLILGYGTNEAFAGKEGVEKFAKQYRRLLSDVASAETRCVFLTIPRNQTSQTKLSNAQVEYNGAIKELAKERNGIVTDVYHLFQAYDTEVLTEGGYLPSADGYKKLAAWMMSAFSEEVRKGLEGKSRNPPVLNLNELEPLRQLILQKNQLYFYKYRPSNDTYLFLFRKHEQGNNAAEIPKFVPLIAELDAKINELKGKR